MENMGWHYLLLQFTISSVRRGSEAPILDLQRSISKFCPNTFFNVVELCWEFQVWYAFGILEKWRLNWLVSKIHNIKKESVRKLRFSNYIAPWVIIHPPVPLSSTAFLPRKFPGDFVVFDLIRRITQQTPQLHRRIFRQFLFYNFSCLKLN